MHVAVVGGGIAGLVAARDLSRAGAAATLFERAHRLWRTGGVVRARAGRGDGALLPLHLPRRRRVPLDAGRARDLRSRPMANQGDGLVLRRRAPHPGRPTQPRRLPPPRVARQGAVRGHDAGGQAPVEPSSATSPPVAPGTSWSSGTAISSCTGARSTCPGASICCGRSGSVRSPRCVPTPAPEGPIRPHAPSWTRPRADEIA